MTSNRPVSKMVLKPCPFCGSADVEMRESVTDVMVACNNCGCRTGLGYLGASDAANAAIKREVANVWSTRTPTATPSDDDVEKVARALCIVTGADPDALGKDGKPRWFGWGQFARAAIAVLQAVPAASEVGWQPIESAPKDGTRIDLWVEHVSGLGELTAKRFTNAKWYAEGWTDNYGNRLEWKVDPSDVEEGCSPDEGRRVTHWRPLPEPPALKASGEE